MVPYVFTLSRTELLPSPMAWLPCTMMMCPPQGCRIIAAALVVENRMGCVEVVAEEAYVNTKSNTRLIYESRRGVMATSGSEVSFTSISHSSHDTQSNASS